MITPTTKTVLYTLSTLMVVGMLTSLISSSETYFVGQERVSETSVTAELAQTSVLTSDVHPKRKVSTPIHNEVTESIERTAPPVHAPLSCEDQHLYTYRGEDVGTVFNGSCIACPMNKFNVQSKSCTK